MEHGIGLTAAHPAMPIMFDAVVPNAGCGPIGEVFFIQFTNLRSFNILQMRLMPDWATFRTLQYQPGHSAVMGEWYQNQKPVPSCPRFFLKRMISLAKEKHNLTVSSK